jgi:hypothetical protein
MHDGLSARTFIHFEVTKEGRIPQGTQVLTKLTAPWGGMPPPVPNVISAVDAAPASEAASAVFEVERSVHVDPALTAIPIYTWGRHECCLPRGATTADLQDERPFQPGDLMVFEEVKATTTGLAQDADRTHRQAVRLVAVSRIADPLEGTILTRVVWDSADALTTPFCLSFVNADGDCIDGVTTAHGNIALAHHGKRTRAKLNHVGRRVRLEEGPVSHWQITAACAPVASLLQSDPRQAAAAVDIRGWKQVDSLLDSDPNDSHFVAEIDNAGRAVVRFGDGAAGRVVPAASPPDADQLVVDYHVGLGPSGNVASDSIGHVILPEAPVDFPDITRVRNPLPAWGGTPPEPLEQVKLTAPASLRQGLLRAVTEEDYARAAEMLPEVSKAVATFRWTGTWHTVFLTVDPAGGTELTPELRRRVQKWVGRFLQTGYDLRIQEPVFVPLEVEVLVCTAANHFRADVMQALLRELGTGTLAGGRRAFFHPDQFTFGQPLFLSQLYAAIAAVPGVRAAQIRKLQRFGRPANNELENGVVRVGRTEVIRCDNNPNFAEHGVLRLQMEGSK